MRFAAVGIAVVVLVAAGVFDALRTTRLADLQASGSVQAKLDAIPMQFGEWQGETRPFDDKLLKATRAVAYSSRRYTRTGAKPAILDVLILAGEPGEIGAHDPERCYGGTGYRSLALRSRKTAADVGLQHSIWSEKFARETLPAGSIEVAWAWTPDGHWQAAEDARLDYAGRNLLYKMYISRTIAANESETVDPTLDLMTALAPLARMALAESKP